MLVLALVALGVPMVVVATAGRVLLQLLAARVVGEVASCSSQLLSLTALL